MNEVDDFLMHYGVKGMKWGKRQSDSSSGESKPKMSREKKIAIAVGVGTTVAIGAAVAYNLLNKDSAKIDLSAIPVQTLTTNKTMMAGKSNLIFGAASMPHNIPKSNPTSIPVKNLTTNKTMLAGKANLIFNAAAMKDVPVQNLTTNKTMLAGKANLIFNAAAMKTPVPPAPKQGLVDKVKEKGFDVAKNAAINKLEKTSYSDFKAMGNPPPRVGLKAKTKGALKDKANEIIIKKVASASAAKAAQFDAAKKKR